MDNSKDYVDYQTALALKECGFDEPCDHIYLRDRKSDEWEFADWKVDDKDYNKRTRPQLAISAPLLYHAQKWLREVKNIIVDVSPDWNSEDYCMAGYLTGEWYFSVWKDGDRVYCNFDPNAEEERIWMFEKYEQALSAGIAAALELIEQEKK